MSVTEKIEARITELLEFEIDNISNAVRENMIKNDQRVTGKTENSLRKEVTRVSSGINGILWGANYIDTLEVGISPDEARKQDFTNLATKLHEWYEMKSGLQEHIKMGFAMAQMQVSYGSALFRSPNKLNVYSNERKDLYDRISDAILEIYKQEKILEE